MTKESLCNQAIYEVKFSWSKVPVILSTKHYQEHLCKGLHYNWFREFLGNMNEIDYVKKIGFESR